MNTKKYNLIPDRLNIIENITKNSKYIESIIDFKNSSDNFEYPNNIEDIRELLPKNI